MTDFAEVNLSPTERRWLGANVLLPGDRVGWVCGLASTLWHVWVYDGREFNLVAEANLRRADSEQETLL